jgi:hypothetical protein
MADITLYNTHFIFRARYKSGKYLGMPVVSSPYGSVYDLPTLEDVLLADVPTRLNGLRIMSSVLVPAVVPPSMVFVVDASAGIALPSWVPVERVIYFPGGRVRKLSETGYTFSPNCKSYILLAVGEFARKEMPALYEWLKGSAKVLGGNRLLVNAGEGGLVVSKCPICLECGVDWVLPCGHAIHRTCINAWMGYGNGTCTVCRQNVVV